MDEEKGASRADARRRLEVLRSIEKFDAFCQDYFPEAYAEFSSGMERTQKETILLAQFDASDILQKLDAYLHERVSQHHETKPTLTPAFPWSHRLLQGVPLRAAESIQRFLEHYLGTDRQRVGFGGRTKQIGRLKAWADSPQEAPYLVLQAPTGRGKSALLCHLIRAFAQETDRALVFLPVSLRFGLSLAGDVLPALLGRLAALHGEPPPVQPGPADAKALLSQLLRRPLGDGRRLLVVLDGLDEAGDWELGADALPPLPPETRVLLSLRQVRAGSDAEVRQNFGLRPNQVRIETLPVLDLLDVLQAVRALSTPGLSPTDEARLAERLAALSKGEPLVLSLLLEECQSPDGLARLRAPAGVDLRAGLGGLWDLTLKPSEQAALSPTGPTWTVLALLACARAPLARADLITLAGLGSGEALDRALQPIQRWVLRLDGEYVFSHPGLREFVYDEKLGPEEQQKWEQRFVAWGQRIVDALQRGDSHVARVPPYLLQCLTIHLQRCAVGAADWLCILSDVWTQAWETPLGRAGLRRDLERAQTAFSKYNQSTKSADKPVPYLTEYLRCALWTASLRSYENNLPLTLLPALMAHDLLTPAQALEHVRSHLSIHHADSPGWERSRVENVLLLLAETLPLEVAEIALALATRTNGSEIDPLLALLKKLTRAHLDLALLSARRLHQPIEQAKALLAIFENLSEGDSDTRAALQKEALEQVWQIPVPYGFLNLVPSMSKSFEPKDRQALLARAAQLAFALSLEGGRRPYLTRLIETDLPLAQRDRIFLAALETASQSKKEPYEIQDVLEHGPHVSPDVLAEGLEQLVGQGRSDGVVAWLFRQETANRWAVLQRLVRPTSCEQIAQSACEVAEKKWQQHGQTEELRALDVIGRRASALAVVRATPDLRKQQMGLQRLADWIPLAEAEALIGASLLRERGLEAKWQVGLALDFLTADTFDTTAEIVRNAVDPVARASGLLALLPHAPERVNAALSTAIQAAFDEVTDADDQTDLLYQLFEQQPTPEHLDWILAEPAEPSSDSWPISVRARRLASLAATLNEPYRVRTLEIVFDLLDRLPASMRRYQVRSLLQAKDLPEPLRQRAVGMFRQEILDRDIVDLLPHLPDSQERKQVLREVMSATQRIKDEDLRIETAAALSPSEALCANLLRRAEAREPLESRFLRLASLSRSLPFYQDRATDAACRTGRFLLFSENVLARSYLIHRGDPAIVQAVVQDSFQRALLYFESLAPILKWWRLLPADDHDRFHDLKRAQQTQLGELRGILRDIGPHLSAEQAEHVLAEVPWFWFEVRAQAATRLPIETRAKVLQEQGCQARALPAVDKASALASLVPALLDPERGALIAESLAEAGFFQRHGTGYDNRSVVLFSVAPYLQEGHLERAAELAAQALQTSPGGLAAFLAQVPAGFRHRLARLIYTHAQALAPPQAATVLAGAAPHLEGADLAEAVRRVSDTSAPQSAAALADAAPQMDEPLLAQAFKKLCEINARCRSTGRDTLLQASATLAAALVTRNPKRRPEMLRFLEQTIQERGTKRPGLLQTLTDLAPLVSALEDPGTPDAAALEVLDVERRWP